MPGTFGTHKKFVAKKEKNKAAAAAAKRGVHLREAFGLNLLRGRSAGCVEKPGAEQGFCSQVYGAC
jgi:hypothetical protein